MTRSTTIAAATLVAFSSACILPPPAAPPPTPPTLYYSAAVQMEQSETRDASADESGPLTADAPKLIHPGVKIAFYPPNECATPPSEAGTGASKEGDLIRMFCGALMSRLEAQAAKAKYEVVSWQALKHNDKPPLEMARELSIDVMFEVNELSINKRDLGTSRATGLTFGQQTDPTNRTDVGVTPDVAQRCKAVFDPEIARITPSRLEVVLDAKGVEVKTGRALWYYKQSKAEDGGASEQRGVELFYPTAGKVDAVPVPRRHNRMQRTGGIVAITGGGFAFIGALLLGVGVAGKGDTENFVVPGAALVGVGLAAAIAGGVLIGIGNSRQKKNVTPAASYPAPVYDPPEKIICAYPPVVPPWKVTAGPAQPQQPTTSTSYSFNEQTAGGSDNERARREKLVREAADQFVSKLGEMSAK